MKTLDKIAEIEYYLNYAIEAADRRRTALAAKLTESSDSAEYALRWLNGDYEVIYTGALALQLREAFQNPDFKDKTPLEIFAMYLEQVRYTFTHWYPENSTNPFSNACHNEKFNALRKWLERLESVNRKGGN